MVCKVDTNQRQNCRWQHHLRRLQRPLETGRWWTAREFHDTEIQSQSALHRPSLSHSADSPVKQHIKYCDFTKYSTIQKVANRPQLCVFCRSMEFSVYVSCSLLGSDNQCFFKTSSTMNQLMDQSGRMTLVYESVCMSVNLCFHWVTQEGGPYKPTSS